MNKSIIALAVASTLGVWGGANATDITENQTTDKTGVSANETYNPKLSRAKVYRASEKPEALFYGEASAEGGNPVTMSISF